MIHISLMAEALKAKAYANQTRVEPAAVVREDRDLMAYTVEQTAILLARLLFARQLGHLPTIQRAELLEACREFVDAQVDEHAPVDPTEPDAMDAAKYAAEGDE